MPHVWPLLLLGTAAWPDHPTDTDTMTVVPDGCLTGQQDVEREALMQLYRATNGPAWTHNDGWAMSAPVCGGWYGEDWYGVSCDGNGSVIGPSLTEKNLTGSLPTALANLTKLEYM
jgi:hypothetical protein